MEQIKLKIVQFLSLERELTSCPKFSIQTKQKFWIRTRYLIAQFYIFIKSSDINMFRLQTYNSSNFFDLVLRIWNNRGTWKLVCAKGNELCMCKQTVCSRLPCNCFVPSFNLMHQWFTGRTSFQQFG